MNVMTRADVVTIEVPAEYSYLKVLRLSVSSLAADLHFDIEEVEAARAAVEELSSALIGATDLHHRLAVAIRCSDDSLQVTGRVEVSGQLTPPDRTISAVLDDSTVEWSCGYSDGHAEFGFTCTRGRIGPTARLATATG